jgi:hypothetical protein
VDGGDGDLRWWRLFAGVVRTGRAYYFGLASGSGGLCGCLSGCLGLALVALRVAAALQDRARGAPMYGCSVQHSSAQVSGSQGARHSACAECAARDNPRSFDVMNRRLLWRVNGLAGESLRGGLGGGSPRRGDDVHDAPLAAACLARRLPMSRGQDVRVCSRFCGGCAGVCCLEPRFGGCCRLSPRRRTGLAAFVCVSIVRIEQNGSGGVARHLLWSEPIRPWLLDECLKCGCTHFAMHVCPAQYRWQIHSSLHHGSHRVGIVRITFGIIVRRIAPLMRFC